MFVNEYLQLILNNQNITDQLFLQYTNEYIEMFISRFNKIKDIILPPKQSKGQQLTFDIDKNKNWLYEIIFVGNIIKSRNNNFINQYIKSNPQFKNDIISNHIKLTNEEALSKRMSQELINEVKLDLFLIHKLRCAFAHNISKDSYQIENNKIRLKNSNFVVCNDNEMLDVILPAIYIERFGYGLIPQKEDKSIANFANNQTLQIFNELNYDIIDSHNLFYSIAPHNLKLLLEFTNYNIEFLKKLPNWLLYSDDVQCEIKKINELISCQIIEKIEDIIYVKQYDVFNLIIEEQELVKKISFKEIIKYSYEVIKNKDLLMKKFNLTDIRQLKNTSNELIWLKEEDMDFFKQQFNIQTFEQYKLIPSYMLGNYGNISMLKYLSKKFNINDISDLNNIEPKIFKYSADYNNVIYLIDKFNITNLYQLQNLPKMLLDPYITMHEERIEEIIKHYNDVNSINDLKELPDFIFYHFGFKLETIDVLIKKLNLSTVKELKQINKCFFEEDGDLYVDEQHIIHILNKFNITNINDLNKLPDCIFIPSFTTNLDYLLKLVDNDYKRLKELPLEFFQLTDEKLISQLYNSYELNQIKSIFGTGDNKLILLIIVMRDFFSKLNINEISNNYELLKALDFSKINFINLPKDLKEKQNKIVGLKQQIYKIKEELNMTHNYIHFNSIMTQMNKKINEHDLNNVQYKLAVIKRIRNSAEHFKIDLKNDIVILKDGKNNSFEITINITDLICMLKQLDKENLLQKTSDNTIEHSEVFISKIDANKQL